MAPNQRPADKMLFDPAPVNHSVQAEGGGFDVGGSSITVEATHVRSHYGGRRTRHPRVGRGPMVVKVLRFCTFT